MRRVWGSRVFNANLRFVPGRSSPPRPTAVQQRGHDQRADNRPAVPTGHGYILGPEHGTPSVDKRNGPGSMEAGDSKAYRQKPAVAAAGQPSCPVIPCPSVWPVRFELTEQTRHSLDTIFAAAVKPGQRLFPGRTGTDRSLTTCQYAHLVSECQRGSIHESSQRILCVDETILIYRPPQHSRPTE
jgi:hypothetical protein